MNNTRELIKLQKMLRNGEIKSSEIPKEQINELKDLYYKQIDYLETQIEKNRIEILQIKNKI